MKKQKGGRRVIVKMGSAPKLSDRDFAKMVKQFEKQLATFQKSAQVLEKKLRREIDRLAVAKTKRDITSFAK